MKSAPKSRRVEIDTDPGSYLFDFDHHTDCEDSDSAISLTDPKLVIKMRTKSTPNAEAKRVVSKTSKPAVKPELKANTKIETKPAAAIGADLADIKTDNKPVPKTAKKSAIRASARLGKKPASTSTSAVVLKTHTPWTEEEVARAAPIEMRRHVSDNIDTTGWFDTVPLHNQRPETTMKMADTMADHAFKVPIPNSGNSLNSGPVNTSLKPENDAMEIDSNSEVSDFDDVST